MIDELHDISMTTASFITLDEEYIIERMKDLRRRGASFKEALILSRVEMGRFEGE